MSFVSLYSKNKELLLKVQNFQKKCLKGTAKMFTGIMAYSSRTDTKRLCSKPKSQRTQDFFGVAKCINQNRNSWRKCFLFLKDRLSLIKFEPDLKKIPQVCWY